MNPLLSAFAQVFGMFDFNTTPMAPLGIKGVIHLSKSERKTTWSDHGLEGWYIGPCLDKYRNYRIWINDSKGVREHNSVDFFPVKSRFPNNTSEDRLIEAVRDLTHELQHKADTTGPLEQGCGTTTNRKIRELKQILQPVHDKLLDFGHSTKDQDSTSPRVKKGNSDPTPLVSAQTQYDNGTVVYKEFFDPTTNKKQIYKGEITYYKKPYYRIVYSDGDYEDLTHAQVGKYAAKMTNSARRTHTTRGLSKALDKVINQLAGTTLQENKDPFNEILHNHLLNTVYAVTHEKTGPPGVENVDP